MRRALTLCLLLTLAGCSGGPATPGETGGESSPALGVTPPPPAQGQAEISHQQEERSTTVLFLGDSLSAGFGLASEEAFPALVAKVLAEQRIAIQVINAGVSGDTSAGGLARLDWLLRQQPDVVVIELGGNDGLRGLDTEVTEQNLRRIILRSRAAGTQVLLAGMQMPPNYGVDYQRRFAALYPKLAAELAVPLIPFLLEGVGGDPALNQPDGIHPTAAGQKIVAQTVARHLAKLLQ